MELGVEKAAGGGRRRLVHPGDPHPGRRKGVGQNGNPRPGGSTSTDTRAGRRGPYWRWPRHARDVA
eukprot:3371149-Lingulodinium_polyedra.AAC.1